MTKVTSRKIILVMFRSGAFEVYQAYLKTFEKASEADLSSNSIEREAKRCVLLAIKVPTIIDFAEVLRLKAVKHLQEVIRTGNRSLRGTKKCLTS